MLKDISGKGGYTGEEQKLCGALKDGPLITMELADLMDKDPHFLRTERLEEEGVIIKSGLTPTDMMAERGFYDLRSRGGPHGGTMSETECVDSRGADSRCGV